MIRASSTRRGFTLIEVMAAVSLLAVVSGLLFMIINRMIGVNTATSHAIDCMIAQDGLVEWIRRDVADADVLPEVVGAHKADEHHVLIELEDSVVRYRWDSGVIVRYLSNSPSSDEWNPTRQWPLPKTKVRFVVGDLMESRDILFVEVNTRIRIGPGKTRARRTHYEIMLP